jgi:uncharacterized protein (TIGR01777 family)
MKILITGGTGLIGRELSKQLIENGHAVYVLSRNPNKAHELHDSVIMLAWDGKTVGAWGDYVNEIDVIVNLAGAPLNGKGPLDIWLTQKRKHELVQSRVNATNALLDCVEKADRKPLLFVQASAIGYYGPRGDELILESEPAGNDFLASVQVQSEKVSERALELGMRRIVVRTGLVLAKNEGALQYFKLQHALFAGGRIGSGKQYYSWIHLQDEAAAIRYLIEQDDASGIFNFTSPNPATNKEFSKTLGRVMNRPTFFVIPEFLIRLVLGEIADVIVEGQRVIPDQLQKFGFEFQYPELYEALEDVIK